MANALNIAEAPCTAAPADAASIDLLQRWLGLSGLEQRAFAALTREIKEASSLVESATLDLSERFQLLAAIAQGQANQVQTIIAVANSIEVEGEVLPLQTAMEAVEQVLRKFIDTILTVSKHAMRMVYALDDVVKDVESAEHCVAQIKTINTQARYLALNAAIEASRFGAEGAAFGVIANEIKDLSLATDRTSREVQNRIASITSGVRSGHELLQEIATLDLSVHILAKEKLNRLVDGIIRQNASFTQVLSATAASSAQMASTVGQLVTGIQFQDRTKQHLEHVVTVMSVLEEATRTAQAATLERHPGRFDAAAVDQEWLQRIVDGQTLGAVKQRILTRLLTGSDEDGAGGADEGGGGAGTENTCVEGDLELF